MQKVVFRVDANKKIGLGHISRTLCVIDELKGRYGNSISISILTNDKKTIAQIIGESQYNIEQLSLDNEENAIAQFINMDCPDLIFFDTPYNYTEHFALKIRKLTKLIFLHAWNDAVPYANAFIVPSAHNILTEKQKALLNTNKVNFYTGFDYIIINNQVKRLKEKQFENNNWVAITTGGSDPKGVIFNIIEFLRNNKYHNIEFIFLAGTSFMHEKKLESIKLPANFKIIPFDLSTLSKAEIVIATFGVTSYELLYLGKPFLSIGHALANAEGSKILADKTKAFIDCGLAEELSSSKFFKALDDMMTNNKRRDYTRDRALECIDGEGASRIALIIRNILTK